MIGEVVSWPRPRPDCNTDLRPRLDGILAILRTIDNEELLAALPECDIARAHHTTGLALLAIVERELLDFRDALN